MERPKRKHPRLKNYDYSMPGYYYITIQKEKSAPVLSSIGQGPAPAGAVIRLSTFGMIAQRQLMDLEKRFSNVRIDKYVIMPTHIHAIICLTEVEEERSSPTLMGIVGAYKSLTTRECNARCQLSGRKLFQTSFYETVLRNEKAYQECWKYIDDNPDKWLLGLEQD